MTSQKNYSYYKEKFEYGFNLAYEFDVSRQDRKGNEFYVIRQVYDGKFMAEELASDLSHYNEILENVMLDSTNEKSRASFICKKADANVQHNFERLERLLEVKLDHYIEAIEDVLKYIIDEYNHIVGHWTQLDRKTYSRINDETHEYVIHDRDGIECYFEWLKQYRDITSYRKAIEITDRRLHEKMKVGDIVPGKQCLIMSSKYMSFYPKRFWWWHVWNPWDNPDRHPELTKKVLVDYYRHFDEEGNTV